jgi:RNA polymerase sigma factor (sigma-70 family)
MKSPATADTFDALDSDRREPGSGASVVTGLFKRQAAKVRQYLSYRLGSDEDGKDAAQEAFLRLVRRERVGSLREDPKGSYLYSAVFTVAVDAERERAHRSRNLMVDADADTFPANSFSPEEQLHWRRALAHFGSRLEALDEGPRNVFVMRYFKEMTYPEIAKHQGTTVRTVERHLLKAINKLTDDMKDYL